MRKVLYLIIVVSLFLVPVEHVEVGRLLPVRAIAVYTEGDMIALETDTELKGVGPNADAALRNLKDSVTGILFLDTVEYIFVTGETENEGRQLEKALKRGVQLHVCEAANQVSQMAEYLDVHGRVTEMRWWRTK